MAAARTETTPEAPVHPGGQASATNAGRTGGSLQTQHTELITPHGKTSISDSVVQKVAGVSAQEIDGVHAMGTGRARALGSIRERLPVGSGPSPAQGVQVEVGERQAAVDIDIVCEYGVSIVGVAQAVREHVIENVERMTGLEVTEVNVTVDDIWMGDDGDDQPQPARVQ